MNTRINPLNILKGLLLCGAIFGLAYYLWQSPLLGPLRLKISGKKTVADRVEELQKKTDGVLAPLFLAKNANYPDSEITLLFIKSKKTLSLYAKDAGSKNRLIKTYSVLAASGRQGPKLREGDLQVPEGIYGVEALNPNSTFHLALRVNFPNKYDLERAKEDNRESLGADIMIHGNSVSIGCIAIGDEAIEEIFVLAAKSKYRQWKLIFAPVDFREDEALKDNKIAPTWLAQLYEQLKVEMSTLPLPAKDG